MNWNQPKDIPSRTYTCGYCGNVVASSRGFSTGDNIHRAIHICPHCDHPTYMQGRNQTPGVAPGTDVQSLPADVEALYREARNCTAVAAYTSAVLACRKLLMNIAVSQGDDPGKTFVQYVEYLANAGFVPPNGKGWVDHIRRKGNEATHEIALMSLQDAEDLITFSEMLLKFVFEFPNRVPPATP
jgi:hypothetical protein